MSEIETLFCLFFVLCNLFSTVCLFYAQFIVDCDPDPWVKNSFQLCSYCCAVFIIDLLCVYCYLILVCRLFCMSRIYWPETVNRLRCELLSVIQYLIHDK